MGLFQLVIGIFVIGQEAVPIKDWSQEKCVTELTRAEKARTPAKPEEVLSAIKLMRNQTGELLFEELSPDFKKDIVEYFSKDENHTSRLEQFYALLFLIGKELSGRADDLILDVPSSQHVLRVSHVFPTSEFIDSLVEAKVDFHPRKKRSAWGIKLKQAEMIIPLNGGTGYLAYQHGLCQRVQNVLLYGGFEAEITRNSDRNIYVKFKEPIDFEGSFGSRGIVDIDLNFVSLFDIEFIHGTKIGVAKVRIADKEFERNDHSTLLRWAAAVLTQRATQPIDW